jgi:uncharacterized protein (DUF305 family)
MTTLSDPQLEPTTEAAPARSSGTVVALVTVIAVAALLIFGAGGYVLGQRTSGKTMPSVTSVDAGFAYDMSVHHLQAVTMAGYARDHTTDGVIKELAYDIETSQFNQVGQFQGWLDTWKLPVNNPNTQMAWMQGSGHVHLTGGLMPGMATVAQINKLETMTGKALDIYFLQLMLHHHQGGLPMAQWAAGHASEAYVRQAAQKMATAQQNEILQMEQDLRQRGASPLPPPES